MLVPIRPEGQVHLETSSFGGKGLVDAGDWPLFSYGEGRSDLGVVHGNVMR